MVRSGWLKVAYGLTEQRHRRGRKEWRRDERPAASRQAEDNAGKVPGVVAGTVAAMDRISLFFPLFLFLPYWALGFIFRSVWLVFGLIKLSL